MMGDELVGLYSGIDNGTSDEGGTGHLIISLITDDVMNWIDGF